MANVVRIVIVVADTERKLVFEGREAFTLDALIESGPNGIRPIDRPAPRWSGYVHKLRQAGLFIETVREPHGGDFPGRHGRYVLHTEVLVVSRVAANDNAAP